MTQCVWLGVHRIVSLLPAATEIAAALGLMDQVVGVSHECDFPRESNERLRVTHCPVHDAGLTSGEVVKNDPSTPPADASAIQAVTPSDIFNWQGPTEHLTSSSERIATEQKWYALTGRVVDLRAEEDGDLHIALADATGDKPGTVVVEIPAKPQWCELRQIVFWLGAVPVSVSRPIW
jgi:hypothetical protein